MLCVPGTTLWSTISIDLSIPYWSISIALTVVITACIVTRLSYMRRQLYNTRVGSGSEYISVSAMLIESAALYSINGIIQVVSYGVNSPIQNLALPVLGQTQVQYLIDRRRHALLTFSIVYRAIVDYLACTPRTSLVQYNSCYAQFGDRNWR